MLKKALTDKRNYKIINLKNNLRALLIQDPEADSSSAAMGVRVGAFSDPKEFPGLAHFCEHMLFMGTKKYPNVNDFSEYLNANNGHSNAFTDTHATVYHFESSNDSFVTALDKFSQFFVSPLFDINCVEKELKAIESEHQKNLQSDVWRVMQLIRSESHPESINNIFATGNAKTLNPNNDISEPRNSLLKFFENYYNACRMSLVVDSPIDVDKMEEIILEKFSEISSGNGNEINYKDMGKLAYDSANLGSYYVVESITDKTRLRFKWFLEPAKSYYKVKPLNYLSSLFGHEGKNSLFSTLVKDGLATELSAGPEHLTNIFSTFNISITLSEKGLKQIEEVSSRVMKFIKLIQSLPINKRYYEEIKIVSQISFDYKNREKPLEYCENLSYIMNDYKEEDILSGPYIYETYDGVLIKKYLQDLTVDKMNVYLTTKNPDLVKDLNLSEKWYGTKYRKENFSGKFLEAINNFNPNKDLVCEHPTNYPEENKFLPKSLEVKSFEEVKYPKLIAKNENSEIWYKPDTNFKRPKAVILCQIYLDKSLFSYAEYDAIAYTWSLVIESKLKEISYLAEEAECNFALHFNNEGMFLKVNGFNDSMKNALKELVEAFTNIKVKENVKDIETQLEKHIREMQNFYLQSPYSQAFAYLEYLRVEPSAAPNEKLFKLLGLTKNGKLDSEKFEEFVSNFLKTVKFCWVIQGNLSDEDAREIHSICNSLIKAENLTSNKIQSFRVIDQEPNTTYSYVLPAINENEPNSCIVSCYSWNGPGTMKERMRLSMVESLLKEKFFDSLRTTQGLGYIVQCFLREQRKIPMLLFLVQSNTKSCEFIWQKISEFINEKADFIRTLDDETFNSHIKSLISEKKKKDTSLEEETMRNFNEIKKRDYTFDIKELAIKELEEMKKSEVIETMEKLFFNEKRRLDSMVLSSKHKEEHELLVKEYLEKQKTSEVSQEKRFVIDSISEYKRRNKLHPDYFMDELKIPKF